MLTPLAVADEAEDLRSEAEVVGAAEGTDHHQLAHRLNWDLARDLDTIRNLA
jgi:hypothetical protein